MATKISTILDEIDNGSISLPVFQRGYVWNRTQVRELFKSLYNGYPVGSLLVWKTSSPDVPTRGDLPVPAIPYQILLDGQQRITSLYGVIRGRKPAFFDGNARAFQDLRFHLEDNEFEFYQPVKMRKDPLWIDVTGFYRKGTQGVEPILKSLADKGTDTSRYMGRLLKLLNIPERELFIDDVTGEDKTVDIVVDIFNRVNSGGTKLTHGDLALAKISAEWNEARETMQSKISKWHKAGYYFSLDWLLRVMNSIITGRARFIHLHDVAADRIKDGLTRAENYTDKALNIISNRMGLDHDQVLFAKLAIPLLVAFYNKYDKDLTNEHRDKLLFWYAHSGMWGRYTGSAGDLDKHLTIIKESETPAIALESLIGELHRWRGGLVVEAQHFEGSTRRNRFYSVLYMMTRMGQARDLYDGLPLKKNQLGKSAQLELHHIFPKKVLYDFGYNRRETNALANFCFLTQESNRIIWYSDPSEYLAEVANKNPGALESQWIPVDPELWKVEKYNEFLKARRELLAEAANKLLNGLRTGPHDDLDTKTIATPGKVPIRPVSIADDEEEALIHEINEWAQSKGLSAGIFGYELVDPITGEQLAMFDLAWPEGVQSELSEPVAILIDEDRDVLVTANRHGYRFFVNKEDFQSYINNEILPEDANGKLTGENETTEFKSTLRVNLRTGEKDKRMEDSVLKTLAGFLNREGGTLFVGVADDGTPIGIQADKFASEDKMSLHLVNLVKSRMGPVAIVNMHINYETHQETRIMKVVCQRSPAPVYVKEGQTEKFFVRMGPATEELLVSHIPGYIKHRFNL